MSKLTLTFFTIIAPLLFLQTNCKDEITPPVIEQPQDTTSHNFTVLKVDTLGSIFSFAHGIDIVDENNIWVAGIFTERDTNGEIVYNKNLAHWNGQKWELMGIKMQGFGGPTDLSIQELKNVKMFDDSTIVVTSKYSSFARWNKNNWISFAPPEGVWEHFWARSANEIYFVGSFGSVTHYNGQTFTKINTGLTNPPLTDVWGDENTVYAVGTGDSPITGTDAVLLSGNNTNWNIITKYNLQDNNSVGTMTSIFRANKSSNLWLLGGNIRWQLFQIESLFPFKAKLFFDFPADYGAFSIRGTADNDLYVSHQQSSGFFHYNGETWYNYETYLHFILFQFAVKRNVWVSVGAGSNGGVGTAIIVIGKHN